MRVTRKIIRYADKPQISLSANFKTDNVDLIREVVKECYGALHVFLNYEEE
jgi:hypothetical protein